MLMGRRRVPSVGNQKASVVAELKNHFGTDDLDKLAVCLSKGK